MKIKRFKRRKKQNNGLQATRREMPTMRKSTFLKQNKGTLIYSKN